LISEINTVLNILKNSTDETFKTNLLELSYQIEKPQQERSVIKKLLCTLRNSAPPFLASFIAEFVKTFSIY